MKIDNKNLTLIMAKQCLLVKDLAIKSDVDIVTITRIRKGKQAARPATVGKLARALDVDVEEIIIMED